MALYCKINLVEGLYNNILFIIEVLELWRVFAIEFFCFTIFLLFEHSAYKLLPSYLVLDLHSYSEFLNPLSANPTKWSNTLKQYVGNLPTNCLSVFDHFVKLTLKGLRCAFILHYWKIFCT